MASGRVHKFACIFILLIGSVLLSTVPYTTEARPLQGSGTLGRDAIGEIEGFSAGKFSLRARKISGPSPGVGHKYDEVKDLGGIKNAGPSPGEGHKSVVTGNKH